MAHTAAGLRGWACSQDSWSQGNGISGAALATHRPDYPPLRDLWQPFRAAKRHTPWMQMHHKGWEMPLTLTPAHPSSQAQTPAVRHLPLLQHLALKEGGKEGGNDEVSGEIILRCIFLIDQWPACDWGNFPE